MSVQTSHRHHASRIALVRGVINELNPFTLAISALLLVSADFIMVGYSLGIAH